MDIPFDKDKIYILHFADDIVLLAENESQLQMLLYCQSKTDHAHTKLKGLHNCVHYVTLNIKQNWPMYVSVKGIKCLQD